MSKINKRGSLYRLYYEEGFWRVRYPAVLRDTGTVYDRVGFETLGQALSFIERNARHQQGIIEYADKCCCGSIDLAKQDLFGEDKEAEDETESED